MGSACRERKTLGDHRDSKFCAFLEWWIHLYTRETSHCRDELQRCRGHGVTGLFCLHLPTLAHLTFFFFRVCFSPLIFVFTTHLWEQGKGARKASWVRSDACTFNSDLVPFVFRPSEGLLHELLLVWADLYSYVSTKGLGAALSVAKALAGAEQNLSFFRSMATQKI